MNTNPQPPMPEPSEAEKKIAQQFLTESRMLRAAAPDPDTSIAAAQWEKRLMAFLTPGTPTTPALGA